ncbi:MAG: exonuclease domain-containing protein [candidate division KSB1 bacterium]|nr:exonuclease domain-containing protein [candidate division KSB1 bacterium]MDZ7294255.1 exonuclease domain-containing protein [candidate division KSB1 bacterium]MDZ7385791.1 exonuclease domain-containing protein [candidate division KSB1 bacterium]MDZ7393844.1 exonuclease domain-containing protein [candidate division KSB1 bacterium]MDZ7412779.1 exonuclease domain-containing protein [candidate division KSB1 bacterium]
MRLFGVEYRTTDYVVIDLEATCWQERRPRECKETIEIGAVRLDGDTLRLYDEFATFVRPMENPELSDFCRRLTRIRQKEVDSAPVFTVALAELLEWLGPEPVLFCSWGTFDRTQLRIDCRRHGVTFPEVLTRHVDLKRAFADWRHHKRVGLSKALQLLGMQFQGTPHRGLDDARNVARVAQIMFPELLRKGYFDFRPARVSQPK